MSLIQWLRGRLSGQRVEIADPGWDSDGEDDPMPWAALREGPGAARSRPVPPPPRSGPDPIDPRPVD